MAYLWLKAFHIIAMVAWFAGMFYIFRLYVYHAKHRSAPALCAAYTTMERKLLYAIMHPAMAVTILFGLLLIRENPMVLHAAWFHAKLLGIACLIAYHFFAGYTHRRFAAGDFFLSEKACRMINEIPTLILIAVVILVVVKPF